MSLFQAREWWFHKPDAPEETHEGCLCIANIDNDPRGGDKILTGSFSGFLRIYQPRQQGYKVDDLMEFQLDEPILQIEAGRFVKSVPAGRARGRCKHREERVGQTESVQRSPIPRLQRRLLPRAAGHSNSSQHADALRCSVSLPALPAKATSFL